MRLTFVKYPGRKHAVYEWNINNTHGTILCFTFGFQKVFSKRNVCRNKSTGCYHILSKVNKETYTLPYSCKVRLFFVYIFRTFVLLGTRHPFLSQTKDITLNSFLIFRPTFVFIKRGRDVPVLKFRHVTHTQTLIRSVRKFWSYQCNQNLTIKTLVLPFI